MMDFYADGFVRLPPEQPAMVDREALRAEFAAFQAANDYTIDEFQIRRVEVSGDMGYTIATYTDTATPKAGGASETSSGRWAIMWARVDGVWKVRAEIWNLAPPN